MPLALVLDWNVPFAVMTMPTDGPRSNTAVKALFAIGAGLPPPTSTDTSALHDVPVTLKDIDPPVTPAVVALILMARPCEVVPLQAPTALTTTGADESLHAATPRAATRSTVLIS